MNSEDLMRLGPAAQKQVMDKMRKTSKYKAQKTRRGKLTFDSKKEPERYDALMMLQKTGEIRGLKLQVRYWLPVVEDVKGMRTREYAMKAKLFRSRYGFAIREV